MAIINPSLASANPLDLRRSIERLGDIPHLHLDIEDGNFVPNITFGLKTVRETAKIATARLDAHLLVTNPNDYLADLAEAGLVAVAGHYEAVEYPLDLLGRIRSLGMRAGLALNFKTPAEALEPFVDGLDYIIIMLAEPDGGAFAYRPSLLEKVRRARALLPPRVSIWVDGGVSRKTLPDVVGAGADTVVLGRAIWGEEDPRAAYRELARIARDAK